MKTISGRLIKRPHRFEENDILPCTLHVKRRKQNEKKHFNKNRSKTKTAIRNKNRSKTKIAIANKNRSTAQIEISNQQRHENIFDEYDNPTDKILDDFEKDVKHACNMFWYRSALFTHAYHLNRDILKNSLSEENIESVHDIRNICKSLNCTKEDTMVTTKCYANLSNCLLSEEDETKIFRKYNDKLSNHITIMSCGVCGKVVIGKNELFELLPTIYYNFLNQSQHHHMEALNQVYDSL